MQYRSLSDRLHANRIRNRIATDNEQLICDSLEQPRCEIASLLEAINRVRSVGDVEHVEQNNAIFYDDCKLINRALLFKSDRFTLSAQGRARVSISWISLASDSAFLLGLVRLICSGLGCPGNQEAGALLLCNLCMVVARDTARTCTVEQRKLEALAGLIRHVVGPLLIIINNPPLAPLIPHAARTLDSLAKASVNCQSHSWFHSALLVPHVIKALLNLLPKPFSRSRSEVAADPQVHLERMQRVIIEGDLDWTALSALFELLTTSVCAVSLTDAECDQLGALFGSQLLNIFRAIAYYWPCESCRTIDHLFWTSSTEACASCETLWNELDEEVAYATETILRCMFITISTNQKCQQILLHDEPLAEACLQLALKLSRCRTNTLPSCTTKCVLYSLRFVGQIMSVPNLNRQALNSADRFLAESLCSVALWLSYRMDWSMCAAEVCSTVGNVFAYLEQSPFSGGYHEDCGHMERFWLRCLLPALNSTVGTNEALRLIYNMLECSTRNVKIEPLWMEQPYWSIIFTRLERLCRELLSIIPYLPMPDSDSKPDWLTSCAGHLLHICELLTSRCLTTGQQLPAQVTQQCPNLCRICLLLSKYSFRELLEQHRCAIKILSSTAASI